jgi:hypothetical protein
MDIGSVMHRNFMQKDRPRGKPMNNQSIIPDDFTEQRPVDKTN